jgi:hypothetical protein
MEIGKVLKDIKDLKAEIVKKNGNSIILKLSTKDLLLYLVTKDSQQDEDIKILKEKVNMLTVTISGIVVALIASICVDKII